MAKLCRDICIFPKYCPILSIGMRTCFGPSSPILFGTSVVKRLVPPESNVTSLDQFGIRNKDKWVGLDINNDLALIHTNPLDAEKFQVVKIIGSEWVQIRIKSNRQILGVLQSTGTLYTSQTSSLIDNPKVSGMVGQF